MKLAKIEHLRCGDYQETTWVWIPDAMTPDEMEALCDKAQVEYLAAEDAFKSLAAVSSPGYQPNFASFPDRLVRDVAAEHKALSDKWKEREKAHAASRKPFTEHLVRLERGFS